MTHRNIEKDKEWHKNHYIKNKEKLKEYHIKYNLIHKDQVRNNRVKREYGITLEKYNELFDEQHGYCAICGRHQNEFKYILSVDHDHETRKIRGLLCVNCNTMLGHINDDINILQKAIEYLKTNV